MNSKDFAIGILSTTAVILVVGLLIINTRPESAIASGMTTTGQDYVLTVGADASTDEELVYLIDAPAQKMIVYRFDGGRQQIEIVQGIDLGQLSDEPGKRPAKRSRGRSSGGRGGRP